MSGQLVLKDYQALMQMDAKGIMERAWDVKRILMAILARESDPGRAVFYAEDPNEMLIGQVPKQYTWNFDEPDNRAMGNVLYLRFGTALLLAARQKGATGVLAYMGPELVYAIDNGSVSRWSFDEVRDILRPQDPAESRKTATILAFAPRARAPMPA